MTIVSQEDRRNAIFVIASDPAEYGRFCEEAGDAALPYLLHSMCVELLGVSAKYEEEVTTLKDTTAFLGGMLNGLLFGESGTLAEDRDPEDPVTRLSDIARAQGAAILAATGVRPVPTA